MVEVMILQSHPSTTIPAEQSVQAFLHCLHCDAHIELPRDPNRKFEPHCPKCGAQIELACPNCGRHFAPVRWRFGKDGHPTNRFHSRPCGAEWLRKQTASNERQLKEEMEREEGKRLTREELETCRLDPAWEARLGILDRAVCRVCGIHARGHSLPKHLQNKHDGMTTTGYRLLYPGAPLMSCADLALSPRGTGDPKIQMQKLIDWFVLPAQLIECRGEGIEWEKRSGLEDFVVCRHCGGKYRHNLAAGHLETHELTKEEYRKLYPNAPVRRAAVDLDGKRRYAELRALAEEAKRRKGLPKGGRTAEDDRAAMADSLYNQGLRWDVITAQVEARFHVHTSVKALQALRSRWLKRQEKAKYKTYETSFVA